MSEITRSVLRMSIGGIIGLCLSSALRGDLAWINGSVAVALILFAVTDMTLAAVKGKGIISR